MINMRSRRLLWMGEMRGKACLEYDLFLVISLLNVPSGWNENIQGLKCLFLLKQSGDGHSNVPVLTNFSTSTKILSQGYEKKSTYQGKLFVATHTAEILTLHFPSHGHTTFTFHWSHHWDNVSWQSQSYFLLPQQKEPSRFKTQKVFWRGQWKLGEWMEKEHKAYENTISMGNKNTESVRLEKTFKINVSNH